MRPDYRLSLSNLARPSRHQRHAHDRDQICSRVRNFVWTVLGNRRDTRAILHAQPLAASGKRQVSRSCFLREPVNGTGAPFDNRGAFVQQPIVPELQLIGANSTFTHLA